jgi:hypothetical protein
MTDALKCVPVQTLWAILTQKRANFVQLDLVEPIPALDFAEGADVEDNLPSAHLELAGFDTTSFHFSGCIEASANAMTTTLRLLRYRYRIPIWNFCKPLQWKIALC